MNPRRSFNFPSFIHSTERNGSNFGWFLTFVVVAVVGGAGFAGYIFYKYRLRVWLIQSLDLIVYTGLQYHWVKAYRTSIGDDSLMINISFPLQSYMDSEIMAIMSQYMPLDNQHNNEATAEAQPLRQATSV